MRADINSDNLTLAVRKDFVTSLMWYSRPRDELRNLDTSLQLLLPKQRSQIHSPEFFVGC